VHAHEVQEAVEKMAERAAQSQNVFKTQQVQKRPREAGAVPMRSAVIKPETESKLALTMALQAFLKRTLTKGDVVYEVRPITDTTFQAVLTLVCLDGRQFAGDAQGDAKAAEKSAAKVALDTQPTWSSQHTPPPVIPQEKDSKTQLVEFVQRWIGRACKKGDIVYETHSEVSSSIWATVTLVCKDGRCFESSVCATDKEAEKSAAQAALVAYADEIASLGPPTKKRKADKADTGSLGPAKKMRVPPPPPSQPAWPPPQQAVLAFKGGPKGKSKGGAGKWGGAQVWGAPAGEQVVLGWKRDGTPVLGKGSGKS
jgi:hypothetical protein